MVVHQVDEPSMKLPGYDSPHFSSVSLKLGGGRYMKAGESSMVHVMQHHFNPPSYQVGTSYFWNPTLSINSYLLLHLDIETCSCVYYILVLWIYVRWWFLLYGAAT